MHVYLTKYKFFLHKGTLPRTPVKGLPLDPTRDPIGGPGPYSWVLALRTWCFLQAIPKSWKPCGWGGWLLLLPFSFLTLNSSIRWQSLKSLKTKTKQKTAFEFISIKWPIYWNVKNISTYMVAFICSLYTKLVESFTFFSLMYCF